MEKKVNTRADDPTSERNFGILRECLSVPILRKATSHTSVTKNLEFTQTDAVELSDFIDYLAEELYTSLPESLRTATHDTADTTTTPENLNFLPAAYTESLVTYQLALDTTTASRLVREIIDDFVSAATAPPPIWSTTRTEACEICERDVPLSYHHLIPRSTHKKVLRRGWHPEWMLNSVAWLCRPCHSKVHRVATNEELAREYWTVKKLLAREDIQTWAEYVGRQRWGGRGRRQ